MLKRFIKKIPFAKTIYRKWIKPVPIFHDSQSYWVERYQMGLNSGDGSYNNLAKFKAQILNDFVKEQGIETVIEFGSGDGNQLTLSEYPDYTGFDISPTAIQICKEKFSNDASKKFKLVDAYTNDKAQLTLSLDVIYHLIEDSVFEEYISRLFTASEKYVIIYASDSDENTADQQAHVKHRKFTDWVKINKKAWQLIAHIPNKYPRTSSNGPGTSFADFYIYKKD